jgi:hypothetical protein
MKQKNLFSNVGKKNFVEESLSAIYGLRLQVVESVCSL